MKRSRYWDSLNPLVEQCLLRNASALEAVAGEIYASLAKGGVWHLFGSGHSALLVEEAFHRAGGLVPVNPLTVVELSPMVNPKISRDAERSEGKTPAILALHKTEPGEVIWIVSNSGINPAAVDLAIAAKAANLRVWALTCLEHSRAADSRHSSGKRLFELADGVIDTLLPPGDAIVETQTLDATEKYRNGAASLILGSVLLHSVETRVVELFIRDGLVPPVYKSANLAGGDEHNKALEQEYALRIKRLRD